MKKKNHLALFIVLTLSILLGTGSGHIFYQYNQVYKVCYSEAGVIIHPSHFFKNPTESAHFAHDSPPFDINTPGEYQVRIKNGLLTFTSTLIIEDTIPPQGTAIAVNKLIGSELHPEEFVIEIIDATKVNISFVNPPDNMISGRQDVSLRLTDEAGNQTVLKSSLFISELADKVIIEAGEPLPTIHDFIVAAEIAFFIDDINLINNTIPGEYPIKLNVDGGIFETTLNIIDTVPPVFNAKDITGFSLIPREAAEFVTDYFDISPVTFHFEEEPDLTHIGTQEVTIIARDGGGNEATQTAQLTLKADTEAPVIKGAVDFTVQVGDTITYMKNVVAIDNNPFGLEFYIDQSAVDVHTPGTYPVRYIARDFAGNETIRTINLTIVPREYCLDAIIAKADEVLERIFTEGMTERDKLWAIYRYNVNNIFFEATWEKGTWLQAAYDGLFNRRGDCYVYAMTAKILLDRAEIKNEDIEKIVTSSRHYWHLVDIGDGWFHFDTTPRSDKVIIFMWTNEQLNELMEETRYRSHRYDPDIYPSDRRPIN